MKKRNANHFNSWNAGLCYCHFCVVFAVIRSFTEMSTLEERAKNERNVSPKKKTEGQRVRVKEEEKKTVLIATHFHDPFKTNKSPSETKIFHC